jgi:drug/metabolite transporter (DMT)-like permease
MTKAAYVLGILLILVGLVWMGQGSGYFPYPAESFMIDQTPWIYWGAVAAAVGVVVIALARRRA